MINDKTKNILSHLGKIFVFVAEHFLFSLFMVIFSVIFLANILFYKYYISNQGVILETEQERIIIDDKAYNDLVKIWEEQDKKFQDSESKSYLDLFKIR